MENSNTKNYKTDVVRSIGKQSEKSVESVLRIYCWCLKLNRVKRVYKGNVRPKGNVEQFFFSVTFLLLCLGGRADYCHDVLVCLSLSVCLSLRLFVSEHISGTALPIFINVCEHYLWRWLVLLLRRCDTLCTSGLWMTFRSQEQPYTQSDSTGAVLIWHRGV